MPTQLPPPGAVFLDHVAHFVPAMDMAAAALERCGFRLTPFTAQANRVEGAAVAVAVLLTERRQLSIQFGQVNIRKDG